MYYLQKQYLCKQNMQYTRADHGSSNILAPKAQEVQT